MRGKKRGLLEAVVLLSMLLSACLSMRQTVQISRETDPEISATPTAAESPRGGTLVIGLCTGGVVTLDPADHRDRHTETVIRNMFDGLFTRTPTAEVVPEIARSAEMIEPTVWEFKIREGIFFHNGELLTAEDVKFSFDRTITKGGIEYPEPHTSPRKGLIGPLERVEVVDAYTVRFYLSAPWPALLSFLPHHQIVPKDYLERVGTKGFVAHPIGCGPFKFVEGQLDDQIVMERFDDYYGGSEDLPPVGPASLDRLIFRFIPEDSIRMAALKIGEVQIVNSVPIHAIESLEADPNVVVKTTSGTRPHWMDMNVTQPPFNDLKVRQAMNYAVDVQIIVDQLLKGRASILAGPLMPTNYYADPTLEPYGHDRDKALALLKEAGWQDTNGDGYLNNAAGERFAFVIDTETTNTEYAEALAGQLRAIRIDASVRVWPDPGALRSMALEGKGTAYLGSWGNASHDPIGNLEAKWRTTVAGTGKGRGNFALYSNPRLDELIDAGELEADVARRHEIYNKAQRIVYEQAPAIFLFVPEEIEACRSTVWNWVPSPDGRQNMHDVWLSQ